MNNSSDNGMPAEPGELMDQFHAGQEHAFSVIYKKYYNRVLFFSRRFVPESDAQDATAESFIQLWHKRTQFPDEKNISNFLFITARNRCCNILRHQSVRDRHELSLLAHIEKLGSDTFEIEEIRIELLKLLQAEIDKLPQKTREVFLLSYRNGLKPSQIALKLSVGVKTVSNQKLNAIRILKAALQGKPQLISLLILLMQSDLLRLIKKV